MSAPFDPYDAWLGIPPAHQPANHYQLLGIRLYERDPQAIKMAAQRRITRVQSQAVNGQRDLAQQIASELTVARNCLLNTDMKAQYDARLQAAGVRSTPSPPPGARAPIPTAAPGAAEGDAPSTAEVPRAIPVSSEPDDVPTIQTAATPKKTAAKPAASGGLPTIAVADPARGRSPGASVTARKSPARTTAAARSGGNGGSYASRNGSRQSSQTPWIVAGCGAGVVLFVLLIAALNSGDDPQPARQPQSQPTRTAKRSSPKPAPSRSRPSSTGSKWRGGTALPTGPRTLVDLVDGQDDSPVENNTVTGQLTAARRAMSERKVDAAHSRLHAAAELARSPFERQEVERLEKHLDSLETFWRVVQEETYRLRSAQELRSGDDFFMVSEAQGGVLTIRHAGRFHQYTALELPPPLAIAIAEKRMKPGNAETHLHVGSFLAIDAQGDRQAARKHWEQAGEAGAALLPELELAPPVKTVATPSADDPPPLRLGPMLPEDSSDGETPAAPPQVDELGGKPGDEPGIAASTDSRLPVPDAAALADAEARVRETFRGELQGARDSQSQIAAAKQLADVARGMKDDPAARYATYRLARQAADESCHADTICTVVDRTAEHYQIDALTEKGKSLRGAWQSLASGNRRLTPPQLVELRRGVVTRCVELLDPALAAGNYAAADHFCTVAIAAARILKDYRALRDFEAKAERIKAGLRGE